jgi:ABC-type bacteriocin/lantibiotic exporter with double-glycine peptidase domain
MASVWYDVPLVVQGANPICWIACMAMIAAEREGHSPVIEKYNNGFNPNNSSDANPASDMDDFTRRLARCGFSSGSLDTSADAIATFLTDNGPIILTHNCAGFPYGSGWAPKKSGVHAVVITGIDTETPTCWMNNPWGNKDREVSVSAVLQAIFQYQSIGANIAYYQSSV